MNTQIIGHVRSCYGEKFGVPRQPGLVDEAWGELIFEPKFRDQDAVRELDQFSHLWLIFIFHQSAKNDWKPTVRPPRLGGNEKVGVFASRSPFRPNPIGLSCVQLESIDLDHEHAPILRLRGIDLVDGTPVLDIKPYIPYADSLPNAGGGFATNAPEQLNVEWAVNIPKTLTQSTKTLIENTLAYDPRPAFHQEEREYGCLIDAYNVKWRTHDQKASITACEPR